MGRIFDAEKSEWFASFAPGHSWREISEEHERLYGWPLTHVQVKNARHRFGVSSGTVGGRFPKGHVPFNKGRKRSEWADAAAEERMRIGQFKIGIMPHNGHQPIGTEKEYDGYVYVKVAPRRTNPRSAHDNWVQKNRLVWEQANGPIPANHVIVFLDGDRSNCDLTNLALCSRSVLSICNHEGIRWHDRESFDAAVAYAALKAEIRKKRNCGPRKCAVCGETFEPTEKQGKYGKPVVTCPACVAKGLRGRRAS